MSTEEHSPDVIIPGSSIQSLNAVSYLDFEHGTTPKRADLVKTLGTLSANRLFLLPDAGIPTLGEPQVSLKSINSLAVGRKRSQHGVKFGQLGVEGGNDTKTTELVAVKYLSPDKAAHEHLVAKYIDRKLGRQATFQTLGFVKHTDDNRVGIVSRYDHSIVSLDNTLYDQKSTADSRMAAVTIAAKYLAALHGSQLRLVHGDAQPKNIAANSQKDPHFIDLESVRNVLTNAYGNKVPQPEMNKLMDIDDFFAAQSGSRSWYPTFNEADHFVDTYVTGQTGDHSLSEDQIMELLIPKIDDL